MKDKIINLMSFLPLFINITMINNGVRKVSNKAIKLIDLITSYIKINFKFFGSKVFILSNFK